MSFLPVVWMDVVEIVAVTVCTILERISSRKEKLAMQIHLKESLLYEFKNSISPPATSVMFLKHWLMVVFVWVK